MIVIERPAGRAGAQEVGCQIICALVEPWRAHDDSQHKQQVPLSLLGAIRAERVIICAFLAVVLEKVVGVRCPVGDT